MSQISQVRTTNNLDILWQTNCNCNSLSGICISDCSSFDWLARLVDKANLQWSWMLFLLCLLQFFCFWCCRKQLKCNRWQQSHKIDKSFASHSRCCLACRQQPNAEHSSTSLMRGKQQTAEAGGVARKGGVPLNALSVSFLAVVVAQSPLIWFKFAEFANASSLCGLRVYSHLQQNCTALWSPYVAQLCYGK